MKSMTKMVGLTYLCILKWNFAQYYYAFGKPSPLKIVRMTNVQVNACMYN